MFALVELLQKKKIQVILTEKYLLRSAKLQESDSVNKEFDVIKSDDQVNLIVLIISNNINDSSLVVVII